jgi:hypothetical protein
MDDQELPRVTVTDPVSGITQMMPVTRVGTLPEIEAIAHAWMAHQGYTEEQILLADRQTHHNSGCQRLDDGWDCINMFGNSHHPERDTLIEACDMARVAVDALEDNRPPGNTV